MTSTDVASLYGKCPQVTLRNYGAHTTKNDYMKEMAVRVVIGAAARWVGPQLHKFGVKLYKLWWMCR